MTYNPAQSATLKGMAPAPVPTARPTIQPQFAMGPQSQQNLMQGMQGLFGPGMMGFWAGLATGGTRQDQGRLAMAGLQSGNELAQNQSQFTAKQAQDADQFNRTLAQRENEFGKSFGLKGQEFEALERYRDLQMDTAKRKLEYEMSKRPGATSPVGKIMDDLRNGIISQDQADAAIAKAQRSGGMAFRTNPDGSIEFSSNGDLSSRVQGNVQEQVISGERTLGALNDIRAGYRPEYLTYAGEAKQGAGRVIGKMGLDGGDLGAFSAARTSWVNKVDRVFNQYKREITGAAASMQEMEQIRKSIMNSSMSPQQFEAAMDSLEQSLAIDMAIHKRILSQNPGMEVGTPEFDALYNRARSSGSGLPAAVERNAPRRRYNPETGALE